MRHSFVSLLSDEGVPVEQIARRRTHGRLDGPTQTVYHKQLRPVIHDGATVMNRVLPRGNDRALSWALEPAGQR